MNRIYQISRLVLSLTLLWWILADGEGWPFGAAAVLLATLAGLLLTPAQPRHWSPFGALRFGLYFLKASWLGGWDVAQRVFTPALPLHPAWLNYPLRLPPGPGRPLFAMTMTLLPGTLGAELHDDYVTVHLLDGALATELEPLEARIASLFGLTLD